MMGNEAVSRSLALRLANSMHRVSLRRLPLHYLLAYVPDIQFPRWFRFTPLVELAVPAQQRTQIGKKDGSREGRKLACER